MVVVDDISVINAKNANPEPRTLLNSRNLHKNEVEKTKQMNDECILCIVEPILNETLFF